MEEKQENPYLNPIDDFLEGKLNNKNIQATGGLLASAIATAQAIKLAKRGVARGIDTHGFGANVEGSYKQDGKITQYVNNLLMSGEGKRRAMPLEALKSLRQSNNPVELKAVKNSMTLLEEHMSMLRSNKRPIPREMKEFYLNLKAMEPERRMAQAVIQRSMKQPINFKHGGTFINKARIGFDPDIRNALKDKGFNPNKPVTVYDVSHKDPNNKATKHMTQKLRAAATGDPRLQLITKSLKENKIPEALAYAEKGTIKYKGKLIDTGSPVRLVAEGKGLTAKFSPAFMARGGKLKSVKEYVIGGHTQRVHFKPYEGFSGLRKSHADVLDITSYASAGEKGKNLISKARILAAGEVGRKLGIHEPVVTVSSYKHNKPGGGRKKNVPSKIKVVSLFQLLLKPLIVLLMVLLIKKVLNI